MAEWYTISPAPWSVIMYALWALWGSKRLPKDAYTRFHRLAAWVDALWVAGVVVLVGDILWVAAVWIRWGAIYHEQIMLLVYSQIRNVAGLILCFMMSQGLWRSKRLRWGKDVYLLWGLDLIYLALWFGLAPGLEWTHWVYALENGFKSWPWVWVIGYIIGRIITTGIYVKTWSKRDAG